MRAIILLSILVMSVVSCSGPKQTGTSPVSATTNNGITAPTDKYGNDGSGYEKAIVIDKTNTSAGIAEEYKWLRENYPGHTIQGQSLQHKDKKSYDVLHITTNAGEKKDIYFDITKFFGKF